MRVFWLDSDEAIRRLRVAAKRLVREDPEVSGVYLFGSLAEGRAIPGSDADVLIVLDRADARWFDRPIAYADVFADVGLGVDLVCYTSDEAQRVPLAQRALDRAEPLAVRS